jgi:hypothetical protein
MASAPTSIILSLIVAAGVTYATAVLVRLPRLPLAVRWIGAALGAYGTLAFLHGAITAAPFPSLFAGQSLWRGLPYLLQGAVVGGLGVLPMALLVAAVRIGLRSPVPGSRARRVRQAVALATTFAVVLAALPAGDRPGASLPPASGGASPGDSRPVASAERLTALENSFRAMAEGDLQSPRDRWDPEYVVAHVGRDPELLFDWVRSNTDWIPYRGVLRGPTGVLMDRLGNSLDRSLLLATLLQTAGHTVRLANGQMDRQASSARLPALMSLRVPDSAEPASVSTSADADFQSVASEHRLDAVLLTRTLDSQSADMATLLRRLSRQTADHTHRLQAAIGRGPAAEGDRSRRVEAAVEALRDHWWVQRNDAGRWVDLDLLAPAVGPRMTAAAIERTAEPAAPGDGLHHEMGVRLVVEQWAGGTLIERPVLEHVLRPSELHGSPISLQIWPVDWPSDFPAGGRDPRQAMKTATLEQRRWHATLTVGGQVAAASTIDDRGEIERPAGGPMAGLGRAFGGIRRGEPSAVEDKVLTAAWLEYEIRSPSDPPRKIRRDLFDLLEPETRTSRLVAPVPMDEARRLSRAFALMRRTEILPITCQVSPEFMLHLVSSAMISNRDLVRSLARGELTRATSSFEEIASRAVSMPTALYSLALVRSQDTRLLEETFVDRLAILSRHTFLVSSARGIRLREATDIVANEIGVDPTVDAGFTARQQQGVRDTNAELLLESGRAIVGSTAAAFAASSDWVALTSSDDARIDRLGIPPRARWRIRQELAAGYVVVAPLAPVTLASEPYVGWWRVDPRTGDTLGVGADGWGQTATERALLVVAAAEAGFLFQYIWCTGDFGIPDASNNVARALPPRLPARAFAWMDVVVVPVDAASDCFWSALEAALVAAGVQFVAVTWPLVRWTLLRRWVRLRPPGAPPKGTPPPGGPPPNAEPEAPPPPPPKPQDCKPPPGYYEEGFADELSPRTRWRLEPGRYKERPYSPEYVENAIESFAARAKAAEEPFDTAAAAYNDAKVRYQKADAAYDAALSKNSLAEAAEARSELNEAEAALEKATRGFQRTSRELKIATEGERHWRRLQGPNQQWIDTEADFRSLDWEIRSKQCTFNLDDWYDNPQWRDLSQRLNDVKTQWFRIYSGANPGNPATAGDLAPTQSPDRTLDLGKTQPDMGTTRPDTSAGAKSVVGIVGTGTAMTGRQ